MASSNRFRELPAFVSRAITKKSKVFVVSGPSGCGKTTLCAKLLRQMPGLRKSVSMTTRAPRKGERRGVDYIFVTGERFKKQIIERGFLEYARVFGKHYYGTPKSPVINALKNGEDIILCIDVQGAAKIKKIVKDAVFVFILPPSMKELKKRLVARSSDAPARIKKRLSAAGAELRSISMYDYAVVNDKIKTAVNRLVSIIVAEKSSINKRR